MPAIGSSSSSRRRLGGERARELDALLQAVRQAADRRLADVLDLEEVDDLLDLVRGARSPRAARGRVQRLLKKVALHLQVAAGHDVVEHGHALEQRDVLERARDALRGRAMRVHVAPHLAAEA